MKKPVRAAASNTLAFAPPLIISEAEIDELANILDSALGEVENGRS